MTQLEIVGPIKLVGPDGPVSISRVWHLPTPETNRDLYFLVHEWTVPLRNDGVSLSTLYYNIFGSVFPNQGSILYGSDGSPSNELFRLRLYYSGRMTPAGLTPTMFDSYFANQRLYGPSAVQVEFTINNQWYSNCCYCPWFGGCWYSYCGGVYTFLCGWSW